MRTLVHAPAAALDHHPPQGHPEHAGRLQAVLRAVSATGIEPATGFSPASRAALERVHASALIDQVFAASPREGETALDADTWMSPGSLKAALAAAGAGMAGVDAVMAGEAEAVFVAARPPGHHAEPDRAMGFCLFNTIAIAAAHALAHHRLARVAVVDIDVHHGNGTQAWAQDEPACLFASIHQGWIYPGTGAAHGPGVTAISSMCRRLPERQAPPGARRWRRRFCPGSKHSRRTSCLCLRALMPIAMIRWPGWR